MKTKIAAALTAAFLGLAGSAGAAAPIYGFQLGTVSEVLTPGEAGSFLFAPNDRFTGLGGGFVTYDFGPFRLVDGVGQDLNVYEYDDGAVEFGSIDVLISADNLTFFNIEASALPAVDLVGDDAHGNASFRRSYDLGAAVTGLGVSQFRYLRIDGTTSGAIGGNTGFDLDAVAAINYVDTRPVGGVPEPAAWALMILGFGMAGGAVRRRRAALA